MSLAEAPTTANPMEAGTSILLLSATALTHCCERFHIAGLVVVQPQRCFASVFVIVGRIEHFLDDDLSRKHVSDATCSYLFKTR